MTVQLTFDDDPPITGLPDEGSQSKQYEAAPGLGHAEVTPEPVGSGPVVEADYSLPLITTPDVTTVEAGGTVTVEGSGLAASSSGTLALVAADGTVLVETEVTADAAGAIPATALEVPADAVAGDYTLTLAGGAVVIDNVTITVGGVPPVEPEVTADVTEVAPGRTVTASGTGFPAEAEGTVGLYDSAGEPVVEAPVTTDADGGFADAALVVPEGTEAGDLALRATVGDATSPDVTITVTDAPVEPVFTAAPDTVDSGGDEAARTVTASGTGFPADLAGRVSILDSEGAEVVGADATTDADGVLPDTPLIVPEGQAEGDYTVHAEFTGVTVDDVPLTVTNTPAPSPTVQATPDTVDSGGDETARTITVTGADWPAETAGTVELREGAPGSGGTTVVTVDATTDADGAVPATAVIVPEGQAEGDYHIVVTVGELVHDDTAITVTTTPPPADPEVTPDVTEVEAGGTVTASGTGFPAETAGRVGLFDTDTEVVGVDVTTDADGAFEGAALVVPAEQAAGDLVLRGTVGEAVSPDVTVTVTAAPEPEPTVTPDVTTVAPGGVVTAAGTGFPAEGTGTVGLFDADDAAVGEPVEVTTDTDGAFTDAAVTVPADQAEGDLALRGTVGDVTAPDVAITVAAAEVATTTRKARKKKLALRGGEPGGL